MKKVTLYLEKKGVYVERLKIILSKMNGYGMQWDIGDTGCYIF